MIYIVTTERPWEERYHNLKLPTLIRQVVTAHNIVKFVFWVWKHNRKVTDIVHPNYFSFHKSFLVTWKSETRNQGLRRADVVLRFSAASTEAPSPLYSRPEKSKGFPPFCCMDISVCSWNACDTLYGFGRELSFLLVLCKIMSYYINWLMFLTEYSVRLFSLG